MPEELMRKKEFERNMWIVGVPSPDDPRIGPGILIYAKEIIDDETNPYGVGQAIYQGDHWEATKWCRCHDQYEMVPVTILCWMPIPGEFIPQDLEKQLNAE